MNYDEYYDADNLSLPEFITERLDEIVAAFAPYRKSNRLLEVGFGAGSVMEAAARGGWEVSGVEVSRSAVEQRGREVLKFSTVSWRMQIILKAISMW